jgi:predicted DCC family thiol-disulfide oxidoreductase YuxK
MDSPRIILFDGTCGLCSRAVRFIIRRDPRGVFRFASLQSAYGRDCLARYGLNSQSFDTLVLIDGDKAYTRSDAALQIVRHLRGMWRWGGILRFIPRRLRDAVYRWVAKHRYQWFGELGTCMVPDAEFVDRFLDGCQES